VLLACAVLLAGWLGYDYGRKQAPAAVGDAPVIAYADDAQPRIEALERERDTLQTQITDMQDSLDQANRALAAARSRADSLQQAQSTERKAPAAEPQTVAAVVEPAGDVSLKLENLRLVEIDPDGVFQLSFSVMLDGQDSDRVNGTIWIAVNGTSNGQPTRLSLKTLAPERRAFVKMGFDLQQDVSTELKLPPDFMPRNILIEAKPYGDKYDAISETFDWNTTG
jgi:hypothetical protein